MHNYCDATSKYAAVLSEEKIWGLLTDACCPHGLSYASYAATPRWRRLGSGATTTACLDGLHVARMGLVRSTSLLAEYIEAEEQK